MAEVRANLVVTPGSKQILRANGLASLDGLFAVSGAEVLGKPGLNPWRERLRLVLTDRGTMRTFYLKRFRDPPPAVSREVRRSGTGAASLAGVEWAWMQRLAADGVPTVKPVAFGEELNGNQERRSAILMEAVRGRSLEAWVTDWTRKRQAAPRHLFKPLARLVAWLHEKGYVHRDLYLSHLFYDPEAGLDQTLHLIDLQRVCRPRWRRRRWVVKDLAALNYSTPAGCVSRTDRLRWLKAYRGIHRLDAAARRLAYLVVGKTQRIARHDRHRSARLGTRRNRR